MGTALSSGTATDDRTTQVKPATSQARQNLHYLSKRFGWPPGVADECADLEERHPGYGVTYYKPLIRRYGKTGYYARRRSQNPDEPQFYGATPGALETAIRSGRTRITEKTL